MDAERQKELYETIASVYDALPGDGPKSEFLGLLLLLQNAHWDNDTWNVLKRFRYHSKYQELRDYDDEIRANES